MSRLAPESADLGETGNARFNKGAHVIGRHQFRELVIVLEQVRSRTDEAHFAAQDVPKLRHFIKTEFAQDPCERIDALVAVAGLACQLRLISSHGAKFINHETAILNTGAHLFVQKRAR